MKIDITNYKIGDRCAAAWLMSYYQEWHGIKWVVEDRRPDDPRCIPFAKMWPWLCGDVDEGDCPLGNLWIKAPSVFADAGYEAKPPAIPYKRPFEFVIGYHCLEDANYNTARNHDPVTFKRLVDAFKGVHGPNAVTGILNVVQSPQDRFYEDILPRIASCDLFIGGDTGSSHCFAAIHPKRPLIALYPDMSADQQAFEWERVKMGCSQPWNSLPLSFNRHPFFMKDHRFDVDVVVEKVNDVVHPGWTHDQWAYWRDNLKGSEEL